MAISFRMRRTVNGIFLKSFCAMMAPMCLSGWILFLEAVFTMFRRRTEGQSVRCRAQLRGATPGSHVHAECTPSLDELKAAKKAQIDAETSAVILAGFDYAVDDTTYHFSYALDDQQNFSDTANVCLMKQAGMPGLPDSVMWNAYTVPDVSWCA